MLIATFNVNSLRSRLELVMHWLQKHQPDILCLQETKVQDHDFPATAFTETGHHVVYKGEKSYNGVAIVSRQAPDQVQYGFDDEGPADASRLIYTRFGKLHLVNTYVPQGRAIDHPMFAYKLEWFARLRRFFDRQLTPRQQVLWVGDLNVAPQAMDIHNSEKQADHVCFHHSVRQAFDLTRSWGFVDVFRKHHPEPGHFSYFDYRQRDALARNAGWRIDHILATPPLAAKSRDCAIDLEPRRADKPSDHTVVFANF
ncbi:MAG: exodeoxyribonuclease III [Kiritimatiellia bacterium]|nr:exodeoxyribonuclease III [Lentisphaerota bacterium]